MPSPPVISERLLPRCEPNEERLNSYKGSRRPLPAQTRRVTQTRHPWLRTSATSAAPAVVQDRRPRTAAGMPLQAQGSVQGPCGVSGRDPPMSGIRLCGWCAASLRERPAHHEGMWSPKGCALGIRPMWHTERKAVPVAPVPRRVWSFAGGCDTWSTACRPPGEVFFASRR